MKRKRLWRNIFDETAFLVNNAVDVFPFRQYKLKFAKTFLYTMAMLIYLASTNPANIYLLKVNNRNTKKRCKICSNVTLKNPNYVD